MAEMTLPTDQPAVTLETILEQRRADLRAKHAKGVLELMSTRDDLRGVHAHADFVADAVRWTA